MKNVYYAQETYPPGRGRVYANFLKSRLLSNMVVLHVSEWKEGDPPTRYYGWIRRGEEDRILFVMPSLPLLRMCFPDIDYEISEGLGRVIQVNVQPIT